MCFSFHRGLRGLACWVMSVLRIHQIRWIVPIPSLLAPSGNQLGGRKCEWDIQQAAFMFTVEHEYIQTEEMSASLHPTVWLAPLVI